MALLGGSGLVVPTGGRGVFRLLRLDVEHLGHFTGQGDLAERRKQMVPLEHRDTTICGDLLKQSDFWLNFPSTTRRSIAPTIL